VEKDRVLGGIVGICVGDALGLPVEFRSRAYLKEDPVAEMIGYGTHNQPPGTWSSDSSLALCTVEALSDGASYEGIAVLLMEYLKDGKWAPTAERPEIGAELREILSHLSKAHSGLVVNGAGGDRAFSVLSRVLPLAAAIGRLPPASRFKQIGRTASLTNGNPTAIIGSHILSEMAIELLSGNLPMRAFSRMKHRILEQLSSEPQLSLYNRILKEDLPGIGESGIFSDGRMVHTVEAVLWCLLTENDFHSVVLKAVNLGGDADTIGAIAGGLAGYAYGLSGIPNDWVSQLVRSEEIMSLAERLFHKVADRR